MGEIIVKKVKGMSWTARVSLVLFLVLGFSMFMYQGWYEPKQASTALMHNSANLGTKWGTWGVTGGRYGQFTCETCHTRNTTNIKRIWNTITTPDGSNWSSSGSRSIPISYLDVTDMAGPDNTYTSSRRICEACHSKTSYHRYSMTTVAHNGQVDCMQCHPHNDAFRGTGDCLGCHNQAQGNRELVGLQFTSGTSHHVQWATGVNSSHCYPCHWEANTDGSPNATYHGGSSNPGVEVDLVVWNSTSRPTVWTTAGSVTAVKYNANGSRAEIGKLNTVCLGCHNEMNKNTDSFGDGKKPSLYAWDTSSIAARYSVSTIVNWGKYPWLTMGARKIANKAFSAHGNAANNVAGWSSTTGVDEDIPDMTGNVNVLCFDCHNSHGSTIAGRSTSYATFGGILKDTTAGKGGYAVTYAPAAGGIGKATYQAGAALCFDCHESVDAVSTPWGWGSTYGASWPIRGYIDKPNWWNSVNWAPPGQQSGRGVRFGYKNARSSKGTHFGASEPLISTPSNTIDGVCTKCHDPHGVSQRLGANQTYAVPLLKDTFMTSPYKEDAAPLTVSYGKGGGRCFAGYTDTSYPGYHIDQNTFMMPNKIHTSAPVGYYGISTPRALTGAWNTTHGYSFQQWSSYMYDVSTGADRVQETDTQFGGLCLKCHTRAQIQPNPTTAGWMSISRVHNTVKGWGSFNGLNRGNTTHAYVCSKCHSSHASCLPRLMITNCLDMQHRGQKAGGGTRPPIHVTTTTSGGGAGRFPGGGGGYGRSQSAGTASGKLWGAVGGYYYFGAPATSRTPSVNQFNTCHDNQYANMGTGYWTTRHQAQKWNSKTQWSSL